MGTGGLLGQAGGWRGDGDIWASWAPWRQNASQRTRPWTWDGGCRSPSQGIHHLGTRLLKGLGLETQRPFTRERREGACRQRVFVKPPLAPKDNGDTSCTRQGLLRSAWRRRGCWHGVGCGDGPSYMNHGPHSQPCVALVPCGAGWRKGLHTPGGARPSHARPPWFTVWGTRSGPTGALPLSCTHGPFDFFETGLAKLPRLNLNLRSSRRSLPGITGVCPAPTLHVLQAGFLDPEDAGGKPKPRTLPCSQEDEGAVHTGSASSGQPARLASGTARFRGGHWPLPWLVPN